MAWYKVDDRLPTSRKLIRIPRSKRAAAIGVWTLAGAWSMHDLTDGFVPAYMIEEWGGDESHADALVAAGMWEPDERDGDPGYQFVNWDEYQPTKADVEAKRERDRERKRNQPRDKGGKFAGRTVDATDSARKVVDSERNSADSTVPLPSPPLPITNAQPTVAREPSRFPDWWAIWGKKKAKGDAEKAYKASVPKKISHDDLMVKTRAYWDHVKRSGTDLQYVPYPATWLRAEQWDDDLTINTQGGGRPPQQEWMKYV